MSGFSKTRLGLVREVRYPASHPATSTRWMLLMTQQAWASHLPPAICRDFWTAAYQAVDG
jgi:hypothetical protein